MFEFYAIAGFALIMVSRRDQIPISQRFLVGVAIYIGSTFAIPFESLASTISPLTMDNYLLRIDRFLGLDGYTLARYVNSNPLIYHLLAIAYCSLPLIIAVSYVVEPSSTLIKSLVLASILGEIVYIMVPAIGPMAAFANFPWTDPKSMHGLMVVKANYPRNAFPSLHFGWVLILFMNCNNRIYKSFLTVYLFLMALATVGGGQHYFIDLIAAVPFTASIQWVSENIKLRSLTSLRFIHGEVPVNE